MDLQRVEKQGAQVILQYAIPSIIAMVLTSMINIVDGYFIGNYVGTEGLAAVNLGLPIVYLYLAIGLMIAVGGIAIAGRKLGANEIEQANQVFRQTITICVVVTVALTVIMMLLLAPISQLFRADALTQRYFCSYYGILIWELPLMVVTSAFGMFIRGEGNPVFVMITNIISILINTILDYVFAGPMNLGVAGVAWASFISAAAVLGLNVLYVWRKAKIFHFGKFKYQCAVSKEMFLNGSSEFIGEFSMCLSMAAYNYVILKSAGVDGVAAFTIIGYVSYVFSMIIIGFGQGIVPIISFAYGAEHFALSRHVRSLTMRMVIGVAIAVFVVMSLVAGWYCGFFTAQENIEQMVIPGLRIQMSSFAFAGENSIASFYFTSIGKAKESAVISASRGLVVLLIAIFVLPMIFGITGVWMVSLVTELVTMVFTLVFMKKDRTDEHSCFNTRR